MPVAIQERMKEKYGTIDGRQTKTDKDSGNARPLPAGESQTEDTGGDKASPAEKKHQAQRVLVTF